MLKNYYITTTGVAVNRIENLVRNCGWLFCDIYLDLREYPTTLNYNYGGYLAHLLD